MVKNVTVTIVHIISIQFQRTASSINMITILYIEISNQSLFKNTEIITKKNNPPTFSTCYSRPGVILLYQQLLVRITCWYLVNKSRLKITEALNHAVNYKRYKCHANDECMQWTPFKPGKIHSRKAIVSMYSKILLGHSPCTWCSRSSSSLEMTRDIL